MRATAFILLFMVISPSFGQQRVGIDINTTGYSLNLTLSFQKVFAEHFVLNSGLIGGLISQFSQSNQPIDIDNGLTVISPIEQLNRPISMNNAVYQLMSYEIKGRGIAAEVGIGYFHEFSVKHGLKFMLNGRLGTSKTVARARYHSTGITNEKESFSHANHLYTAISPEINHTIRLNGRYTFSYGFKFPYYFQIDQGKYSTSNVKDGFYGLEPEFKIGLTFVIGKCDE